MGGEGGSEWGSVGSMGKGTDQVLLAVTGPSQPSHVARMPHMAHISRCDASPTSHFRACSGEKPSHSDASLLLDVSTEGVAAPAPRPQSSLRASGGGIEREQTNPTR